MEYHTINLYFSPNYISPLADSPVFNVYFSKQNLIFLFKVQHKATFLWPFPNLKNGNGCFVPSSSSLEACAILTPVILPCLFILSMFISQTTVSYLMTESHPSHSCHHDRYLMFVGSTNT